MGTTVLAQTSAGFNLEWYVIGSGGGESSSGTYRVNGTLGHSFTSQPTSGSASFTVSSGYWFFDTGPPGAAGTASYLPVIFKN
jgi:hypothetical protein